MIKRIFALAASIILASPLVLSSYGAAHASEPGGMYLGASLGNASTDLSDLEDTLDQDCDTLTSSYPDSSCSVTIEDSAPVLGVHLGYRVTPGLSIEGGYQHLGRFTAESSGTLRDSNGTLSGESTDTIDSRALYLRGIGHLGVTERLDLNLSLGVAATGTTWTYEESYSATGAYTAPTAEDDSGQHTETNTLWGVGIEYRLSESFSLRGEALTFKSVGDEATTGEGDITLGLLGFTYTPNVGR